MTWDQADQRVRDILALRRRACFAGQMPPALAAETNSVVLSIAYDEAACGLCETRLQGAIRQRLAELNGSRLL